MHIPVWINTCHTYLNTTVKGVVSAFKGVRAESLIGERETIVSLSVYKGSSHIEMARKDYSSLEVFSLILKNI